MKWIYRAFTALIVLAIVGVAAIGAGVKYYSEDLPDHSTLANYAPPLVTRVHAGDGRLMAEFATERRIFVPIASIPPRVQQAFIAAEDQYFYKHPGVDFIGLVRATLQNVQNLAEDRRLIGASTITQQVTRNFLLTNERSVARKAKEILLAMKIEQAMSKDKILELYLNEIYLGTIGGSGAYGVAAAALTYFNKPLDELTVSEAAYLAGLPKAPSNYHPVTKRAEAIIRRDYVIGRMQEDGYITPDEAKMARMEDLTVRRRTGEETVRADYFTEEVRRELLARFGEETVYKGGLSVRASLDPKLQAIADKAFRKGLIAYDRKHGYRGPLEKAAVKDLPTRLKVAAPGGSDGWLLAGVTKVDDKQAEILVSNGVSGKIPMAELAWARPVLDDQRFGTPPKKPADVLAPGDIILVEAMAKTADGKTAYPENTFGLRQIPNVGGGMAAIDPHTGRVLAMIGGFSFQQSQFNRAVQAKRQPGSSFKPFVYMAGLENGYTPATIILDAPYVADDGSGTKWRPENITEKYYGPQPMRVGIEQSRNLMTIRLAVDVGMDKVSEMAKRFGVVDNLPPYPAMALGAGETTALRMAAGYAQIVNGGKRLTPTVIDRVQDKNGTTVFKHDIRPCDGCSAEAYKGGPAPRVPDNREQIIDSGLAYQMLHILEGVVERGTATSLLSLKRPLAGKTGTTNDYTDAWFVGMTPDLVIATYIGFDQPRTLGKNETGGGNVVPIFKDLVGEALEGTPAVPFRIPPGIRMVRINRDTGKLASADDRRAIYEAFRPGTEPNADEPEDEYQTEYGGLANGPVTSGEDAGPILGPAPVPGAPVAPPAPPVPTRAFGTGAGGAASGIY
jgi:penicillin-binding protein 1A